MENRPKEITSSHQESEKAREKIRSVFPRKLRVIWLTSDLFAKDMRKKGQTTGKNKKSINRAAPQEPAIFQISSDRLFLKGYKLPKKISLEHPEIPKYGENILNEEVKKDWCKIARKIKYSPILSLGWCHINYGSFSDKLILKFSKAFSNVISLDLARSVINKKQLDRYCVFLLKLVRLKKLRFLGDDQINISNKLGDLTETFKKLYQTATLLNLSTFQVLDCNPNPEVSKAYIQFEQNYRPLKEFKIHLGFFLNHISLDYSYQEINEKCSIKKNYNISSATFSFLAESEIAKSNSRKLSQSKPHMRNSSILLELFSIIELYAEDIYNSFLPKQFQDFYIPNSALGLFIFLYCLKIVPSGEPINLKLVDKLNFMFDQPDAFSKIQEALKRVPNLISLEFVLPPLSNKSIFELLETLIAIKTLKNIKVSENTPYLLEDLITQGNNGNLFENKTIQKLISFSACLSSDQQVDLKILSKELVLTSRHDNIFSINFLYLLNKKACKIADIQLFFRNDNKKLNDLMDDLQYDNV